MAAPCSETAAQAASANVPQKMLRIGLAASGGGHVRQLLDLELLWGSLDHFFITEDTALGRTLAEKHRTHFVPHFAWGQAKLGTPFRMLARAVRSFFISLQIIAREKPDLILSTGAGAVIFPVLWARLLGAHVVVIESFARFEQPSLFGRIAAPLAHDLIVQSPRLASRYPRAKVFDPFRMLDAKAPPKRDLLFMTVGATLPFDRMVEMVATLKSEGSIPEHVIAQTGVKGRQAEGVESVETLSFDEVQKILTDARIVVCHGGTGSLITALRHGCHVIAVPRLSKLGEHYDDHQAEITEAFERRGLIVVANTPDEMRAALATIRSRDPVLATTDPSELMDFLGKLVSRLSARKRS